MTTELRPLSFGELLDRTFSYYRSHFWVFVGIMAIPQILLVAVALLTDALAQPVGPVDVERLSAQAQWLRQWQARLQRSIARHFDDPADQREASLADRQGLGVPRRRPAA